MLGGIGSDWKEADCSEQVKLNSIQQLARESRIISRKGRGKDKILILIADEASCSDIYKDTINRNIIENNVQLGILSWQDILISINNLNLDNKYQQLMINDLKELLISKGFERFNKFDFDKEILVEEFLFYDFKGETISFKIDDEVKERDFYEFR